MHTDLTDRATGRSINNPEEDKRKSVVTFQENEIEGREGQVIISEAVQ